ncbi:MAG: hypothetical protein ACM34K_10865 [Bacillota bacterium]
MINDLNELQNTPYIKELHLEWTPERVAELNRIQKVDPVPEGVETYNDYYHKFYGCYFVIEVFKNMIALTLRQRKINGSLEVEDIEIGRFFNPTLTMQMASAVRDLYDPSVEHAIFPINDEIREYIRHKLNLGS